jgi:nucleotide-binding universal stress UspA family protein
MSSRILVAYDESPQAQAALEHALTGFPDAEITVLHVSDPREWVYGDSMGGYYSEAAFEQARESAEELLAGAEATAGEHDRTVETVVETGQTPGTIVNYAEEHDVDHVVIGSHGRTGLSRFLLGSVAERVARRSHTSVTIIREENASEENARTEV